MKEETNIVENNEFLPTVLLQNDEENLMYPIVNPTTNMPNPCPNEIKASKISIKQVEV